MRLHISNKKAKVTVAALPDFVYSSEVLDKVSAVISVTYNNKELKAGTDFAVGKVDEISNPEKEKGVTIKAKISGTGNYKGDKQFTFKLLPESVATKKTEITSDFKLEFSKDKTEYTYTGKLIKPSVSLKDENGKKVATSNYKVYYTNNLNVGTATVKVYGTKNYSGSVSTTFKIDKKDINKCKITVKNANLKYTGYDQKKNVSLTVTDGSNVLVEGVDYKLKYDGDWVNLTGKQNKPTVQIVAAETGNYKDNESAKKKLSKNFKITKASLSSKVAITTELLVDGKECAKDASTGVYTVPAGKTPEVVVKCSGVTLKGMKYDKKASKDGMDYTFKIKETKKKKVVTGGTITLNGVNNFTGKQTVKYVVK